MGVSTKIEIRLDHNQNEWDFSSGLVIGSAVRWSNKCHIITGKYIDKHLLVKFDLKGDSG